MPRVQPRLAILACAFAFGALALPSLASASTPTDMLHAINAARAQNGVAPLRFARSLNRGSNAYAHSLARRGAFVHARVLRSSTFRYLGEILGLCSGTDGQPGMITQMWLGSPVHRPILLNSRYRYVGIGEAHGYMSGAMSTFWVVRFGSR